ncbi:MAG: ribonuclease HI family protein [Caldilineaceae bacterium]|nr:ribonuclease HI family protein [Caldilineaceae bacterium]
MNLFAGRGRPGRVWIFCDGGLGTAEYGGARTGPKSYCGCGSLVRGDDGRVLDWAWRALPMMTNNEAEYAGLRLGMELARRHSAQLTIFVLDSEVVVGQMEGRFAVNSAGLRRCHAQAQRTLRGLGRVQFCLAPRAYNTLADALAREAGIPWSDLRGFLEHALPGVAVP